MSLTNPALAWESIMAEMHAGENARKVLDVYAHLNVRSGEALFANNFVTVAARRHWRLNELQDGLDYAFEQGWVEKGPNGSLRLTESGFEEMSQVNAGI